MDNNDYDFKMEWPEEFAEYADLPPISDESLAGIIAAITPVMRQIRIKRRIKSAIKAGTTVMCISVCVFTAVTVMKQHTHIDMPATEMVKQVEAAPPQSAKPTRTETKIVSQAIVSHITPVRLTASARSGLRRINTDAGRNQPGKRPVEQTPNSSAYRVVYSSQETPMIGSAEDITGSKKQSWTEGAEALRKHPPGAENNPGEAARGSGTTLPR